jgi:hypothetical protein
VRAVPELIGSGRREPSERSEDQQAQGRQAGFVPTVVRRWVARESAT